MEGTELAGSGEDEKTAPLRTRRGVGRSPVGEIAGGLGGEKFVADGDQRIIADG